VVHDDRAVTIEQDSRASALPIADLDAAAPST
jgi:hypothetical protein